MFQKICKSFIIIYLWWHHTTLPHRINLPNSVKEVDSGTNMLVNVNIAVGNVNIAVGKHGSVFWQMPI